MATSPAHVANALPAGMRLGEYELRGVIGVGGFGIVYHAFDHALEREVAIKEYMPSSLAGRSSTHHVSVLSQSGAETFALGLRSFVNEARLLARFDHASLVKVHRFWEEFGTAYMLMPLYRGRTLKDTRLAMSGPPDEAWMRGIFEPVLGALEHLHREGVFHRDIAPDNILVGEDGRPVLLDFGAARRVISDRSQTLTAILKPNYAPIEQYAESTGLRQGPWTDLYALGATLHFLITGRPPAPATARTLADDHLGLATMSVPGVSVPFLQLVEWMLASRPADRPQGVAEVRDALAGRIPIPERVSQPPLAGADWQRTELQPGAAARPRDPDATIVRPVARFGASPPLPPAPVADGDLPTLPPPVARTVAAPPPPPPSPPAPAVAPVPPAPVPAPAPAPAPSPAPVAAPAPLASGSMTLPLLLGGGGLVVIAAAAFWLFGRSSPPAEAPVAPVAASAPVLAAEPVAPPAASAAPVAAPTPPVAAASEPAPAVSPAPAPVAEASAAVPAVVPPPPKREAAQAQALPPPVASPVRPAASRPATTATTRPERPAEGAEAPARPPAPPQAGTRQSPARQQAEEGILWVPENERRPAQAPAQASANSSGNPREQCGNRMLTALHMCLLRECVKPEYTQHAECVRVREIEERNRRRTDY